MDIIVKNAAADFIDSADINVYNKIIPNEDIIVHIIFAGDSNMSNNEIYVQNNEKNRFMAWVNVHKKQLIAAGISITVIVGVLVGIKNKDSLMELWNSLKGVIGKETKTKSVKADSILNPRPAMEVAQTAEIIKFPNNRIISAQFNVSQHLRNLPEGMHASAEKVATALEHGYELAPGQTWVESYTKGNNIA